jgi:hypothetical protein
MRVAQMVKESVETAEQFRRRMRVLYGSTREVEAVSSETDVVRRAEIEFNLAILALCKISDPKKGVLSIAGWRPFSSSDDQIAEEALPAGAPKFLGSGYSALPLTYDQSSHSLKVIEPRHDPVVDNFARLEARASKEIVTAVLRYLADKGDAKQFAIARPICLAILGSSVMEATHSLLTLTLVEKMLPTAALTDDGPTGLLARILFWILYYRSAKDRSKELKAVFAIATLVERMEAKKLEPLAMAEANRLTSFKVNGAAANQERAAEAKAKDAELAALIKEKVQRHGSLSSRALTEAARKALKVEWPKLITRHAIDRLRSEGLLPKKVG